jgi:hypothetical protein
VASETDGAKQQNLVITDKDEPDVTVDNIEVAQFVYLLFNNEKIREVIDTIGMKSVLLLGRFTEGRMVVLERLREKLRDLGFVPIVFNFDKPETKDFTETVRLLCNLSHFVIVDITNPRSTPLELQATVPDYMVPFAPILQEGETPFAMFVDLKNKYDWVPSSRTGARGLLVRSSLLWQSVHRLRSWPSLNAAKSPRCGTTWSATVAGVTRLASRQSRHNGSIMS